MDISGRPTVISTFCGTGGSSLGYKWAGFHELLAVDFDAHAVECFKANFPEVPVWHKSVIDVTAKEILDFTGLKCGELDLLDGSPPCQGFSIAGKRVVSDPRNDLFSHYARLVNDLQPKVFVMENVGGMVKGSMKGKFIEIMSVLKTMNYNVKAKLMNAKYYGVPQSRERVIFIGVKKDLGKLPIYPNPSKQLITVSNAFSRIKNIGEIPAKTKTQSNVWADQTPPGKSHPKHFSIKRLHPNKPSNTIPKSVTLNGTCQILHPVHKRVLTINEVKSLCSFPEDWQLVGKFEQQWARLGNSVMPKFMQAIAETIKTEILEESLAQ